MEKLTLETVKLSLLKLAAHFPEAGHNGQTIALVSEDYLSDMASEGVTNQQFLDAIDHSRKSCGFFPKVKDLLESWRFVCANPPRKGTQLQLSDSTSEHDQTPEEVELSDELRKLAVKAMNKEITSEEAARTMEKLINNQKTFKGRMEA